MRFSALALTLLASSLFSQTLTRPEAGARQRSAQAKANETPSFLDFYAVPDGVLIPTGCSITTGSNVVSCPGANWNASHAGKMIQCNHCLASGGITPAPDSIIGTISSIISATSVHMSFNSQRTETGTAGVSYGTDNYTFISNAINNTTSEVIVPGGTGIFLFNGLLPFRSNLTLDCRGGGAVLSGVNPIYSGIFIDAKANPVINGCSFRSINTARHSENSSATIWVGSSAVDAHLIANTVVPAGTPVTTEAKIINVNISGGHGILMQDQSVNPEVSGGTIQDTLADGVNTASGVIQGRVHGVFFLRTGDDGCSATGYDNDNANAGFIQFWECYENTMVNSNANGFREAGTYHGSVHDNIIIAPRAPCGSVGTDPFFGINQVSITPSIKNNHCFSAQGTAYSYMQSYLIHDTLYASVTGNTADNSYYWQLYRNPGMTFDGNQATNSVGTATHAMVITSSAAVKMGVNTVNGSTGGCLSVDSLTSSNIGKPQCHGATGNAGLGVVQATNSTDIDGDVPAVTGVTGTSLGDFIQSSNTRSTITARDIHGMWFDQVNKTLNIGCTDTAGNCGRAGIGINTKGTVFLSGSSSGISGDGFAATLTLRSGVWDAYAAGGMSHNVGTGTGYTWKVNGSAIGSISPTGVMNMTGLQRGGVDVVTSIAAGTGVSVSGSGGAGFTISNGLTAGTGISISAGTVINNTAPFSGCAAPVTSPALCTNAGCTTTTTITYIPSC